MAEFEDSRSKSLGFAPEDISGLAAGLIIFGAIMMMLLGSFHFIVGLAALLDDDFYAVRSGYALGMDVTTWGWLHIVGGILLMVVSVALIGGSSVARILAIVLTMISAVWNFYSVPFYPIWSVMMLVLCIGVLWALIAHGKEFTSFMNEP